MKKLLTAKNSVIKIQNLIMNHESQPVKRNPNFYKKEISFSMLKKYWYDVKGFLHVLF